MAVHYNVLKREVDANRQIYETILQKAKELGITSALRVSNVRVIDTALPPNEAFAVRSLQNPLLGLLTALGLCVAGLLFKSRVDPNLRTPGDGLLHLNVRELGVIPSAKYSPPINSLRMIWKKQPEGLLSVSNDGLSGSVERATHEQKPSLLAESFRSTFASVLFSLKAHQTSVLTITSPGAGTGKSTCSSNLAIAIAETNRRVILIDADMRKPRLHMIFDVPNTWGLSDLLHSSKSVDPLPLAALIRPTGIKNLRLMPSGPAISTAPSQLFTTRLPEILKRLRKECDVIVIDTPPMLQFSDARAVARHSEGVVLVLRSGKSRRDDAKIAIQCLTADGSTILGTVLNDWNPVQSGHSYYNRYYSET
jgi:capsular exopolysaccharide synthesis family protein